MIYKNNKYSSFSSKKNDYKITAIDENHSINEHDISNNNIITLGSVSNSYYGDYTEYFNSKSNDNYTNRISALWKAVMLQTVTDATKKNPTRASDVVAKKEALDFFTKQEYREDYLDLCAKTNYRPNLVVKRIMALIAGETRKYPCTKRNRKRLAIKNNNQSMVANGT